MNDAVLVKLNPVADTILFSTFLGGNGLDFFQDMAVTPQGDVVAVGATESLDFPVTTNALQPTYGGGSFSAGDVLVVKVSPIPLAPETLVAVDVPADQGGAIDLTWTFITSIVQPSGACEAIRRL